MRLRVGGELSILLRGALPCALALGPCNTGHAQSDDLGRLRLGITAAAYYTDNVYYQPEQTQDALGALLRPEFVYRSEARKAQLEARANGEFGAFDTPGSKDNYLDATGALKLALTPTLRNRLALEGSYTLGHDPFGLQRTEGTPSTETDLDEWNQIAGGLRYRYGAPGARINAETGVSTLDKEYRTNRAATEFLDYRMTTVDYALFYNYSPKSSAVLSFSRGDVQFDKPFDNNAGPGGSDLDTRTGNVYQVRTGLVWLATEKTAGDVRGGYRRRTFDNVPESVEGFDWQASVRWSPTPPTLIELSSGRAEEQSYLTDANVIDTDFVALQARRSVTSRTRASVRVEQLNAGFVGLARDDRTHNMRVGFEHVLKHNLFLVGSVDYGSRSSSAAFRDYDRLSGFVGVRLGRTE